MHGDYGQMLFMVGALLLGTAASLVFGFWLLGALIWGKPGWILWALGTASWAWWGAIAARVAYMHITGQAG
jgi:hypothetical protein